MTLTRDGLWVIGFLFILVSIFATDVGYTHLAFGTGGFGAGIMLRLIWTGQFIKMKEADDDT